MDKMTTIWLVIAVYGVFMLAVGILNSRKGSGMEDFTVGGRNAGAWLSALSYGTAYFSAIPAAPAGALACGACWWELEMPSSALCWPGWCWHGVPGK